MVVMVACDRDANQASQEKDSVETAAVEASSTEANPALENNAEESLRTPADLSEEESAEMYKIIFDYNKCMMTSRLNATQDHKSMQDSANIILQSCESHLTHLQDYLNSQDLNKALVIGMAHKMRSKAARKLMARNMKGMAAMAAAADNAEAMKAAEEAKATQ